MRKLPLLLLGPLLLAGSAFAKAKPVKKPASVYKLGGESVSKFDSTKMGELVRGEVKALGYTSLDDRAYIHEDCAWEGVSIEVTKLGDSLSDKTAEKYSVYVKRPAAQPVEGCAPETSYGAARDPLAKLEGAAQIYDKKAEVFIAIQPKFDQYGIITPPERRQAMIATARTLFDALYKK